MRDDSAGAAAPGAERDDTVVSARIGQDGPVVQVAVAHVGHADSEENVTALESILSFDSIVTSVASVSEAMTEALRRARPTEAEVTFGLDVAVESGRLTSLVVKGSGTATFTVRLLWKAPDGES